MITNFFKTTFRNLWKNKTNSFLNIFGLSIGIACAALIFLWVEDELNYDSFNVKKDKIYFTRVNQVYDTYTATFWSTPGVMAPALKAEIPGIANTCRVTETDTRLLFTIGEKSIYSNGRYADSSLFDMFTFPFVQGNVTSAYSQLYSIILTEKTARKFFGTTENVIGKKVRVDNKQDYVVSAILKDIPENSFLRFDWIAPFEIYYQQSPWAQKWGNSCLSTYVELKDNANVGTVNKLLYDYLAKKQGTTTSTAHAFLWNMKNWHLYDQFDNGKPTGSGRIAYVRLFSVIAWIILFIACINFMNLATARSEKRAREVGVKKVLGAEKKNLVLDYCAAVVDSAGPDERRQRLNFWGTLALMRCVASSPAAAAQALRTRAGVEQEADVDSLESSVFDGAADVLPDDDVEPPAGTDDPALKDLIVQAERLTGQSGDPKLKVLTDHLGELIADGFNPVVFCRYIATAHYLGRQLEGKFKNVTVGVVTGEITSDERKEKVDLLGDAERRVLIATDCLSEGVNLQEHFDSVVHFDLSWNPTRHEQREGRVDRFGQERPVVRATLMYGANNPVDGAVLDVILRKAAKIREELGVPVPVPDDGHTLTQVLLKAVLLKRRGGGDMSNMKQLKLFEDSWKDAAENAKKNRTVFAQRRLKPEEVLPEWHKSLAAVGGREDVQRFAGRALARLNSGLESLRRGFKVPLGALPEDVRERLESENLVGSILVDFTYPPAPRCRSVQRSHPLIAVLAETLLERTLASGVDESETDPGVLGRVGCWTSAEVTDRTVVTLLRLRHQLVSQPSGRTSTLLVEEATAFAWSGSSTTPHEGADALAHLALPPSSDPPQHVRERAVQQALTQLETRIPELNAFAERRAQVLLDDHHRVRLAATPDDRYRKDRAAIHTQVHTLLPADIIGIFVLLPRVV